MGFFPRRNIPSGKEYLVGGAGVKPERVSLILSMEGADPEERGPAARGKEMLCEEHLSHLSVGEQQEMITTGTGR